MANPCGAGHDKKARQSMQGTAGGKAAGQIAVFFNTGIAGKGKFPSQYAQAQAGKTFI